MNELVSIVIPTYKRPDRLPKAIDSCINQTYENIQIIVIDDNDPKSEYREKTEKVISGYTDSRLKYIKMEKNSGGCIARNTGIKSANGEFIAFLDDDDFFVKEKIEKQLAHMKANDLDASFSNEIVYDEEGNIIWEKDYKNFDPSNILKYHLVEGIVGTQTFMYKKTVLEKINYFTDAPSGQEYILMYKTILKGFKVGHFNECLVNIIVHKGERISTGKRKLEGEKNLYRIKRKHFKILSFMQRKEIKFTWRVNMLRFYGRRKSCKLVIYVSLIILFHPLKFLKSMLAYIKKIYRGRV